MRFQPMGWVVEGEVEVRVGALEVELVVVGVVSCQLRRWMEEKVEVRMVSRQPGEWVVEGKVKAGMVSRQQEGWVVEGKVVLRMVSHQPRRGKKE